MRVVLAAALFCHCLCAAPPKLVYTKSFPGSVPEYVCVNVDRSGALEYKEAVTDDQPIKAQLREAEAAALFAMAEKLDFFKSPLESGLKVANTGKKSFRYEDEAGTSTQVSFNYSVNETAQQLLDRFEQISATEHAYIELDRVMRYDKLGVNDALAEIESMWLRKQLVAPQQFVPLLTRITTHESFMHLVRDRAARLKDQFQAPAATSEQKE